MIDFAFLTPAERRTPGVLNGYLPTTFRLDRGRPRYQYVFLAASLRKAGLGIVFVVDDNLIGNKKAIKPVLRDIVSWQQERAYPLTLFTEASLALAEDARPLGWRGSG